MHMHLYLTQKILAALICLALGIFFLRKKTVSTSGFISLLAICFTCILLNKMDFLVILFCMFASSSLLTRYKKEKKKEFEKVVAKSGPRDFIQAIANLGPAFACMLISHFSGNEMYLTGFMSSVAAANADSWASEIGGLSKKTPVMITNFKPVEKGISGGVTLLGTLGGFAGSAFIISASWITFAFSNVHPPGFKVLWISFAVGIVGFIFDSILGATVQALYRNKVASQVTEAVGTENQLIKGYKYMNNDVVNLMTTLFAAISGALLYLAVNNL